MSAPADGIAIYGVCGADDGTAQDAIRSRLRLCARRECGGTAALGDGEVTELTVTLPLPPNLANARMHWRAKNAERQGYFQHCGALMLDRRFPRPPKEPLSPVIVNATLYLGARMDDDNALARIKWPVDWLVRHGYLVDDKRPHCRMMIPEQVVKRGQEYRVEITLSAAGSGSAVSETEPDD